MQHERRHTHLWEKGRDIEAQGDGKVPERGLERYGLGKEIQQVATCSGDRPGKISARKLPPSIQTAARPPQTVTDRERKGHPELSGVV